MRTIYTNPVAVTWWHFKRPFQIAAACMTMGALTTFLLVRKLCRWLITSTPAKPDSIETLSLKRETGAPIPDLGQKGRDEYEKSYGHRPTFVFNGQLYTEAEAAAVLASGKATDRAFAEAMRRDAEIAAERTERRRKLMGGDLPSHLQSPWEEMVTRLIPGVKEEETFTFNPCVPDRKPEDEFVLKIKRVTSSGDGVFLAGTGFCGSVRNVAGFEEEVRQRWGGGLYEVSGTYDGRTRAERVTVQGASKAIG